MMKNRKLSTYCVLLASVFLTMSCEKMPMGEPAAKEEPANVVMRVSSFEQVPFTTFTRAAELSDVSTRMNFAIYDETGVRVKQINQKLGDADYGVVRLMLAEGSYSIAAVAHSSNGNPTMTDVNKIKFTNAQGYTDTFSYFSTFVVGEEGVEKQLPLARVVAKIRFMVDEPIPVGTTQIQFYYTGGAGTYSAVTGYGTVQSKQTTNIDVTESEREFEIYTIPHAERDTLEVKVTTHNANTDVLTEKTIVDIPIQRNRITVCHGSLFDEAAAGSRSNSFTVTVDDTWLSDDLTHDF